MIDISWLAEHGPCTGFKLGDTIPCPGGTDEASKSMYILLVGSVDVYKNSAAGGMQKISTLISGDVFGGREYFTDVSDYKYVSSGSVVTYVITEDSFNDLSWSRPDILFEILRAAYLPLRKASSAKPAATTALAAATQAAAAQAAAQQQQQQQAAAQVAAAQAAAQQQAIAKPATPALNAPPAPTALLPKVATTKADAPVVSPTAAKQEPKSIENTAVTSTTANSAKEASGAAPENMKVVAPSDKGAEKTVAALAGQNSGEAPAPSTSEASGIVIEGSIFPEGHKNYSDFTVEMNMQLVFPKDYTCPFCKVAFKDFRVFRSKLYESQPMRYDLRKYYRDFVTEWYDVITCHNCLFSTFHNYFTDPKPIKKAKIEKELEAVRAEIPLDFDAERDINYVFTSHYLALLCSDGYPTMDKQIRGKLWGNLSWLYEDLGDVEMEKFSAAKAAEVYEQVYTETRLTPVQEQITCLSIAGMQHRAGIDNNLKRFLFNAKTHQMGDKNFAKLAEDFMYELKLDDE